MTATRDRTELDRLAAEINAEHSMVWRAGRKALEHAVKCGEALLAAQSRVERGGWLAWIAHNVTVHPTSAYKYMRLARYKDLVLAEGVQGVEAGLRLVAQEPWHDRSRLGEDDKAMMVELVRDHSLQEVAERFGCAVSTVSRWTSPTSPARYTGSRPRPSVTVGSLEITDDMIERMAGWLFLTFRQVYGGTGVTDAVRDDALEALGAALGDG